MSFNYIAFGYQNEMPIVLKLGLNDKALAKQTSCLQAFAYHGTTEVITSEPGMIFMQRANPGTTLNQYFPHEDTQATTILCQKIQDLHAADMPTQHDFHCLKELLTILDNDQEIPGDILSKARQLRDDLIASTNKTVLLHGDLHHENILKHEEGWLVIDSKGFIGDPTFEVCAFIQNPIPELLEQTEPNDIINERVLLCANFFGFSTQRIQYWL